MLLPGQASLSDTFAAKAASAKAQPQLAPPLLKSPAKATRVPAKAAVMKPQACPTASGQASTVQRFPLAKLPLFQKVEAPPAASPAKAAKAATAQAAAQAKAARAGG